MPFELKYHEKWLLKMVIFSPTPNVESTKDKQLDVELVRRGEKRTRFTSFFSGKYYMGARTISFGEYWGKDS